MREPPRFRLAVNVYWWPTSAAYTHQLDVLSPPSDFVDRYNGKYIEAEHIDEAKKDLAGRGYAFNARMDAWIKTAT